MGFFSTSIQRKVEGLIWAILECIVFALEAIESSVSDGLCSDLIPQSVTGLSTEEDVPLLRILENELASGRVSPPSHGASSTIKVELSTELGSFEMRHSNHQLDSI